MTTAYCPWCAMEIDARLSAELRREHDQLQRRAAAAEQIADSLWRAVEAIVPSIRKLRGDDWDDMDVEVHVERLSELLTEMQEAKAVFRSSR